MRDKEETKRIIKRMDFLRDLLAEFDASLCGYQPGVTAFVKGQKHQGRGYAGEALDFNYDEWKWLEPLLIELRDYRHKKYGGRVKRAA